MVVRCLGGYGIRQADDDTVHGIPQVFLDLSFRCSFYGRRYIRPFPPRFGEYHTYPHHI